MQFCEYYRAEILRSEAWFVVAVLKSFDHLSLDRTIDVEKSVFEFFVPATTEPDFLNVMNLLQAGGFVQNLSKSSNRLSNPQEEV